MTAVPALEVRDLSVEFRTRGGVVRALEHVGFAVGKGDPDFLAFLDAWIEAREADTWLPTTHRYWFRTLQWRD